MNQPLVSLVVLNWNGRAIIQNCLDSLKQLTYANREIIVVDNASTDGSAEYLESIEGIAVIKNTENLGYAAGNNAGIAAARGKYVAVINNDIVVEPSWLSRLVAVAEKDEMVGIISGRQMNYYQRNTIDVLYTHLAYDLMMHEKDSKKEYDPSRYGREPCRVMGVSGASTMFRKSMFDALHGFDESLYAYHEESDLCMRAFLAGYKCVFVPTAVAYHMRSVSFSKIKGTAYYYQTRNRIWFVFRYAPLSRLLLHSVPIFIRELRIIRVAAFKTRLLGFYIRAVAHALAVFPAMYPQRKQNMKALAQKKHLYGQLRKKKCLPL
jgi:GT2 family glycosyltransferase